MAKTTHLTMPFIEAAQAQKHVTHNAALQALDAIVMLSVLDRNLVTPPVSPSDGDRYLVGAAASGAWLGSEGKIAAWQDGDWAYYTPKEGWLAWVADEDVLLTFDGSEWTGCATQNARLIGVNTTADTVNKLAVSSSAVLFNHAGNSVQVKLNKQASTDGVSFLFQTGFSGRAEIGCLGNDDFVFKTSLDGSSFNTGLTLVGAANGVPRVPSIAVSAMPDAVTAGAGALAFVPDASGGATLAYSDGSVWRRSDDGSAVN